MRRGVLIMCRGMRWLLIGFGSGFFPVEDEGGGGCIVCLNESLGYPDVVYIILRYNC